VEKGSPNFWATTVISKKMIKETNRPIGEKSPNLVTLIWPTLLTHFLQTDFFSQRVLENFFPSKKLKCQKCPETFPE
jgi:hypothetical protein